MNLLTVNLSVPSGPKKYELMADFDSLKDFTTLPVENINTHGLKFRVTQAV